MTTEQVKTLLGPPDLRELKPKNPGDTNNFVETWHFNKSDSKSQSSNTRVVVFENGQVVSFGRDVPASTGLPSTGQPTAPNATAAGATGSAPASPLEIGEECKKDSECKSDNCHFHVCSGKNNCQVKLGGLCGNNYDCCEGRCDFGKCRQ